MNFVQAFNVGDFRFSGAYICASRNGNNFLVGKNGFSIILSDSLVEELTSAEPSENLQCKLISRHLATLGDDATFEPIVDIKPTYFIIDVSRRCNFNCVYCFRNPEETGIETESVLAVCRFIRDYCRSEGVRKIMIQFWGGEPLLAMENIRVIYTFFQKTNIRVGYDLETNASVMTGEIAKELYDMRVNVGISIDGTQELHDRQRPFLNGKPSFAQVLRGITHVRKYFGKRLSAICVITKYNVRHIDEIIDYFVKELHLYNIKFNVVRDNFHAAEHDLIPSEEELTVFARKLCERFFAFNGKGLCFAESNLVTKLGNLLYRMTNSCCISNGCAGGKKIVSFNGKGEIYPCEMTDFPDEKLGDINTNDLCKQICYGIKRHKYFKEKRIALCDECPWQPYCKGGCSSKVRYCSDALVDTVECLLNREIYPLLAEWILKYPYMADMFFNGEGIL